MCRVLGVSRSGYYDWVRRLDSPGGRAIRNQELLTEITSIHHRFRYYGSPRVHQQLRASGHRVGRHRIARIMRRHGIRACRGKIKARPRAAPPARRPEITDHVQRRFHAEVPDALWFTDITQLRTGEGWLFVAVVLDAFNREVISWATAGRDTPRTPLRALTDALAIRRPRPGCIIHSDRGYQFTAGDWLNLASGTGLTVSLGERKSCLDNAAMESWFASFKNEALHPYKQPATRAEAKTQLFHYIWTYNTERLHSTLGYVAPKHYTEHASSCP